jgi:hypothetical protein
MDFKYWALFHHIYIQLLPVCSSRARLGTGCRHSTIITRWTRANCDITHSLHVAPIPSSAWFTPCDILSSFQVIVRPYRAWLTRHIEWTVPTGITHFWYNCTNRADPSSRTEVTFSGRRGTLYIYNFSNIASLWCNGSFGTIISSWAQATNVCVIQDGWDWYGASLFAPESWSTLAGDDTTSAVRT